MGAKRDSRAIYEFAEFRLDTGELMLYRDDVQLTLPPKAIETLQALIERSGQIVSKDDLMEAIWSDAIVEESNLSRYIHMLRSTLGNQPNGKPYIETFRRRGYRFNSEVTTAHSLSPVSGRLREFPQMRGVGGAMREATTGNIIAVPEWQRDVAETAPTGNPNSIQSPPRLAAVRDPKPRSYYRPTAIITSLMLLIGIPLAVYFFLGASGRPLTDRDVLLIADFENRTGDEIFDGTLKQGLSIQLQQSPFLSLVPDDQVRETLRLMRRPPDEKITRETAKEICLRRGLKAYIAGAISSVGNRYLITLETVNASTGDVLASEMIEVDGKEQTLAALSTVSTRLRERLGESLASIERLATPLDVTTPSLEALKLFTVARAAHAVGDYGRAEILYNRAIELDPEFAMVYANLGAVYVGLGKRGLTREVVLRAYELRHRASEFEQLVISASYYRQVVNDYEREISTLELMKQLYPRKATSYYRLANAYHFSGNFEAALENAKRAIEISGYPHAYVLWTRASLALDRYDEGAEAALKALSEGANFPELHEHLIAIAFLQGNDELVSERLDVAAQRESSVATLVKAKMAAFRGQMRTAEQLFRDAIETAESQESRVLAAAHFRDMAETLAAANRCTPAQKAAEMRGSKYSEEPLSYSAPFVFGLCGNAPRALEFVAKELRNFPEGTLQNHVTAPIVRGLIELRRGNAADAIEQFRNVPIALERQQGFLLWYARGEALLKLNRGAEASVEFQKIIDHRGTEPLSPRYPLSYLGLARSRRQAGDITGSRQAYEQFLALWKDADADLTYLIEAKREYQSLSSQ